MFSMSGIVLALSEFTPVAAMLDFKMAAKRFALRGISLEDKSRLYTHLIHIGTFVICEMCHHSAAILELKMAATLLDMLFLHNFLLL